MRFRPFCRRRFSTRRPPLVRIRTRKPWVFFRRRLLGWNVLFMTGLPHPRKVDPQVERSLSRHKALRIGKMAPACQLNAATATALPCLLRMLVLALPPETGPPFLNILP